MKKLNMILAVGVVMLLSAPAANAVTWVFNLPVHDTNTVASPPLGPALATGFPQYDYNWQLTTVNVSIDTGPGGITTQSILADISPNSGSGSANKMGFAIASANPVVIALPELNAKFYLAVGNGFGYAMIKNIQFGTATSGIETFPVVGAQFIGQLTVTPVPEPATVLLLGSGTLVLLRKRRR